MMYYRICLGIISNTVIDHYITDILPPVYTPITVLSIATPTNIVSVGSPIKFTISAASGTFVKAEVDFKGSTNTFVIIAYSM